MDKFRQFSFATLPCHRSIHVPNEYAQHTHTDTSEWNFDIWPRMAGWVVFATNMNVIYFPCNRYIEHFPNKKLLFRFLLQNMWNMGAGTGLAMPFHNGIWNCFCVSIRIRWCESFVQRGGVARPKCQKQKRFILLGNLIAVHPSIHSSIPFVVFVLMSVFDGIAHESIFILSSIKTFKNIKLSTISFPMTSYSISADVK